MAHVLLVEDDAEMSAYVLQGLQEAGHVVGIAGDGNAGLQRAAREKWDLLIIDRMLPGLDGLSLVRALRAQQIETPILFLTALDGIDDRVTGLNAGADDYMVKPFALAELIARVGALGRRPRVLEQVTRLKAGDLEMDLLTHNVRRGQVAIDLQPREFRLLEYLLRHADQVVTRAMLLENVWDFHFDPHTNVVESHISRLRAKIDKGHAVELIHTVRGEGYCLRAPA